MKKQCIWILVVGCVTGALTANAVGRQSTEYWQRLDESLTRHGARVYLQEKIRGETALLREREVQFRMQTRLQDKKAGTRQDWETAGWQLAVQKLRVEKIQNDLKITTAYAEISELEVKEQEGKPFDIKKLISLYEALGRARCYNTKVETEIAQTTADFYRGIHDRHFALYQKKAMSYAEILETETLYRGAIAELKGRKATQKICKDFLKDPNLRNKGIE